MTKTSRRIYSGHRYGKLIVIELAGQIGPHTYWKCACDCGRRTVARSVDLLKGKITFCERCRGTGSTV